MIHALESSGRRWRISYSSASLASIRSAVASGLGVSLLPARLALPVHRVLTDREGFASLPSLELVLHCRPEAPQRVHDLSSRLRALCKMVMAN